MEEPRQLDVKINLQEILQSINNSKSIKFLATPEQLQITDPQNYSGSNTFQMVPLNFPEDSLKMLMEAQFFGAELNLSYVLLFSHIKNAVVFYSIWRSNDLMLVEINFDE